MGGSTDTIGQSGLLGSPGFYSLTGARILEAKRLGPRNEGALGHVVRWSLDQMLRVGEERVGRVIGCYFVGAPWSDLA